MKEKFYFNNSFIIDLSKLCGILIDCENHLAYPFP